MIKNYDNSPLPNKTFFKGTEYNGSMGIINGYNGYTSTKDDGMLCALIDNSCWDKNGKPNLLKDSEDNFIISKQRRGFIK